MSKHILNNREYTQYINLKAKFTKEVDKEIKYEKWLFSAFQYIVLTGISFTFGFFFALLIIIFAKLG